jgi:hypothetical protein
MSQRRETLKVCRGGQGELCGAVTEVSNVNVG